MCLGTQRTTTHNTHCLTLSLPGIDSSAECQSAVSAVPRHRSRARTLCGVRALCCGTRTDWLRALQQRFVGQTIRVLTSTAPHVDFPSTAPTERPHRGGWYWPASRRDWCRRRDSNPHGHRLDMSRRSVSPVCLPVPPLRPRARTLRGVRAFFVAGMFSSSSRTRPAHSGTRPPSRPSPRPRRPNRRASGWRNREAAVRCAPSGCRSRAAGRACP